MRSAGVFVVVLHVVEEAGGVLLAHNSLLLMELKLRTCLGSTWAHIRVGWVEREALKMIISSVLGSWRNQRRTPEVSVVNSEP
ncbi:hypothetical protein Micbo1qcDRAFT_160490, partial [Microdochium bolleyi]